MRWIVDGNNIMGSRPDGWWRDRPAAMGRLVSELATFAQRTGDEVAVVFDGRPLALGDPGPVELAFASRTGRDAADDDIASRAENDRDPVSLTVATSDAALAARVRAAGAAVEGARAFVRRLDRAGVDAPPGST